MHRLVAYDTEFVNQMPKELKNGILYVAPHYEVAAHLCMCGCGEKVVTPLNKYGWDWTFNNVDVSLSPSVGNFQYNCKSHYFLKNGKVQWC